MRRGGPTWWRPPRWRAGGWAVDRACRRPLGACTLCCAALGRHAAQPHHRNTARFFPLLPPSWRRNTQIVFGTGAFLAPGGGAALLFRLLPDWAEPLLFNLLFTMVVRCRLAARPWLAPLRQLLPTPVGAACCLLQQRAHRCMQCSAARRWRTGPNPSRQAHNPALLAAPAPHAVQGALGRRLEYARSSFMAVADQLMQVRAWGAAGGPVGGCYAHACACPSLLLPPLLPLPLQPRPRPRGQTAARQACAAACRPPSVPRWRAASGCRCGTPTGAGGRRPLRTRRPTRCPPAAEGPAAGSLGLLRVLPPGSRRSSTVARMHARQQQPPAAGARRGALAGAAPTRGASAPP